MDHNSEPINYYSLGAKKLFPIIPGIIPFGLVMGAVGASTGATMMQAMGMNLLVFAGAAQLATLDLLVSGSTLTVIVMTGVFINLRFMMYSAALSSEVQSLKWYHKLLVAFFITDQSYAVASLEFANIEIKSDKLKFYMGASLLMFVVWHLSTLAGFIFGNFAPEQLSLDFVVPLAFMTLVVPAIKNYKMLIVAILAMVLGLAFKNVPYKLGLIFASFIAIAVGLLLDKLFGVTDE